MLHLIFSPRYVTLTGCALAAVALGLWWSTSPEPDLWPAILCAVFAALTLLGLRDMSQTKHAIFASNIAWNGTDPAKSGFTYADPLLTTAHGWAPRCPF